MFLNAHFDPGGNCYEKKEEKSARAVSLQTCSSLRILFSRSSVKMSAEAAGAEAAGADAPADAGTAAPAGAEAAAPATMATNMALFQAAMANAATWQVLLDLVIVCALAISWMLRDAREHGRRAWPYVLLTLAAGSFGPLLYLLIERRPAPAGDKAQTTYA